MVPRRMTAELLAQNLVAHWMQAAGVAGAAWLAVSVLRLREPGFLLKYWQAVLLVLLLAPWVQPWQPAAATPAHGLPLAEPGRESAGVAGVSVAGSVVALPAKRWHVDPWAWVLGLLAAGAVFRLARLGLGLVRLGRLARSAYRIAPPAPAREFVARFRTSATFIRPPDVRMPCSFGLFRPIVVLPAVFDRLEPAFQRGIVCHELLHVARRDFAAAVAEEVAAAFLWFHPWAWLIRTRIRLHREQVVDAAVVCHTGDRRAYVRCLIALAGHPLALPPAPAMLRPTELRTRTDTLLENDRAMSGRVAAALAIGLGAALAAAVWAAAVTVPLSAAATPAPGVAAARGPAPQSTRAGRPTTPVTITFAAARWPVPQATRSDRPATPVTISLFAAARRPEPAPGAGQPATSAGGRRAPRSTRADPESRRDTVFLGLQQGLASIADRSGNDATAGALRQHVTGLQDRLAELTERQAGQRLWSWTLPAAPPDVSRERVRATPSHAPEEDAVEGRP